MTIVSQEQIDLLLSKVRRPSRYIGDEINAVNKPWEQARVKWCLAFPDVYEIGMSHIGLSIIYDILNRNEETLADRVFAPWIDMEETMRAEKVPLWGLETKRSLDEFDIIGITLPYELTYTNILTILDLSGIPFYANERGDNYPLIIGGGVSAFNPEPIADFFNVIVIGDGEEVCVEVSKCLSLEVKGQKKKLLERLSGIRGIYIPKIKSSVNKAVVPDINDTAYPTAPVVPYMQVIHDRVGVEIQRGCARGCRFCQAGYIYRPVRQREPAKINEISDAGLKSTGHEELSFLSLSAGDYDGLPQILAGTTKRHEDQWINLSLPSLRVETLMPDILSVLSRTNPPTPPLLKGGKGGIKGGFTLAPEAATERLRAVINKGNTEADLFNTIDKIFSFGWRLLKLYFMIGLPTETKEDVEAIAGLSHKALNIGRKYRRDVTVTVSVSTFVPKPHTPFQWAGQISIDETKEKQDILKNLLRRRGLELKLHNSKMTCLEGVFARGDRSLARVIVEAWKKGARFDAWDDQLKFDEWIETLNTEHLTFLEEKKINDPLPWGHIFTELDSNFLKKEYELALKGESTPSCVSERCTKCGICDFKEVKNRLGRIGVSASMRPDANTPTRQHANTIILNFTFTKQGKMKWLSHLELMQVFRRAFRRAGLPTKYSQGFHPHMKLSLDRALKVGEASECEKGKVEIYSTNNLDSLMNNLILPDGIKIINYLVVS